MPRKKKDEETQLDPVTQYAEDVIAGKVIAGKLVKLACKRHLKDMENQGAEEFPCVFDYARAERVFEFFSYLKFTGGDRTLVGRPIKLEPFQQFIIGSVFGWFHKDTGYRRFKKAYIQLGRKNGKSLLVSGVGLYMLMADEWWGSQVYATATHKDQAKIVWNGAKKMVKLCPDLKKRIRIKESTSELLCEAKGDAVFKPLSKDTDNLDGFDPHCGIVDEYHQHRTNEMVKLLDDGTVQQTQSLILIITTAGFDINSPCFKECEYCMKILEGDRENEEYFIYIAQMDKKDKPFDERNWPKANPLVCTTEVGMNNLRRLAKEARDKGGHDLRDFLTKSLNIWVDQKENGYMAMEKWKACKRELPDLTGRSCYIGVDLSAKLDLTSVAFEFPIGEDEYVALSHSFMPEETITQKMKTDKVPYDQWVRDGWITAIPGGVIDDRDIIKYIVDEVQKNRWDVIEVDHDPWGARQFAIIMGEKGFGMVEIPQKIGYLTGGTKDLREKAYKKRLMHDGNPVLTWAMSNAVVYEDRNKNIALDKKKSSQRIDPAAALINAHVRASVHETQDDSLGIYFL